jgi:hypothetical protein
MPPSESLAVKCLSAVLDFVVRCFVGGLVYLRFQVVGSVPQVGMGVSSWGSRQRGPDHINRNTALAARFVCGAHHEAGTPAAMQTADWRSLRAGAMDR